MIGGFFRPTAVCATVEKPVVGVVVQSTHSLRVGVLPALGTSDSGVRRELAGERARAAPASVSPEAGASALVSLIGFWATPHGCSQLEALRGIKRADQEDLVPRMIELRQLPKLLTIFGTKRIADVVYEQQPPL